MKKLILLAAAIFVFWNAYNIPEGAEYFHPLEGEARRYAFWKDTGFQQHAVDGTYSKSHGNSALIRHLEKVSIDGIKYHKIELTRASLTGAEVTKVIYSRLTKEGIYTRRSGETLAREYLELPLPPQVGRRWRYEIDDEIMDNEIAAIGSLDIAGKTYGKCVHVKSWGTVHGAPAYANTYYAPDVGIVRISARVAGAGFELALSEQ